MRNAKITESLQKLRSTSIPISSVLDVGIQHSTPQLIKVFPDLPHFLFEPVEEYYPHIRSNYNAVNHKLIQAAVCDFDGTVTLHTEKKTRGDEISHSWLTNSSDPADREVSAIQIDTFVQQEKPSTPYLLKIDVEGPGVPSQILRGARKSLANCSVVVIEMTMNMMFERYALLQEAGFVIWDICDLCYYGDSLWQLDMVLVHQRYKSSIPALSPMSIKPYDPQLWQSGF